MDFFRSEEVATKWIYIPSVILVVGRMDSAIHTAFSAK